jgi:hypothetical protein
VVDEVRKAVQIGYGLLDVFEIWECEVTCFDQDTNSGGLFVEYVNMFLKLNHSDTHAGFKVKKTVALRTTGAQSELL